MIRIIEDIEQSKSNKLLEKVHDDNLNPEIKKVLDEILIPLDDKVIVQYVDETDFPNSISVDFGFEIEPGTEEYLGMWEIDLNKESIGNYSNYLSSISDEIDASLSGIESIE